jgi:hypothetical protein
MIFTIEPMINAGRMAIRTMADGWTIVTKDHSLSAQWEHTILVTETGYEVLTVSQGDPAPARLDQMTRHGHRHPRSSGARRPLPVTIAVGSGDDPRALSLRRRRAAAVARALPPGRRGPLRLVAGAGVAGVAGAGRRRRLRTRRTLSGLRRRYPASLAEPPDDGIDPAARAGIALFYDIGLEMAPSVRTVAECVQARRPTI